MKTRKLLTLAGIGAMLLSLSPITAIAGTVASGQWISYAAKFVCGPQGGVPEQPVVNGVYRTVINIHNPHYLQAATGALVPVVFLKKIVVALEQGQPPLRPSCKIQEFLDADFALAVSCANIRQQLQISGLPLPPNPREGFVVIEVPPQFSIAGGPEIAPELDVTAVYTARHRIGIVTDVADYDIQAMDVEEIQFKPIFGEPIQDPCPPD